MSPYCESFISVIILLSLSFSLIFFNTFASFIKIPYVFSNWYHIFTFLIQFPLILCTYFMWLIWNHVLSLSTRSRKFSRASVSIYLPLVDSRTLVIFLLAFSPILFLFFVEKIGWSLYSTITKSSSISSWWMVPMTDSFYNWFDSFLVSLTLQFTL